MAVVRNLNGFIEASNTLWVESHEGAVAVLMPRAGSGLTADTVAEDRAAIRLLYPDSPNGAYWIRDPATGEAALTTVEFG